MTAFRSISLRNWRQFAAVSIDFHPRLTVITGSNGAGKSTILNICSQHFGYSRPYLSTPRRRKGGGVTYDPGHYSKTVDMILDLDDDEDFDGDDDYGLYYPKVQDDDQVEESFANSGDFTQVGYITYDNDVMGEIGFNGREIQSYGLQINNQQSVVGVPIGSHRSISNYQPVQGLSLQLVTIAHAYNAFWSEQVNRLNGGHSPYSPLYRMKETLIAMAAFGEGNSHLEKNAELVSVFNGFTEILRKVLPRDIGFQKIVVRIPDIILKTRSGEFIVDASSGGITAIIEIAWQLYLFSLSNDTFAVTMDEPENHLHPSMQRSILASLLDAFPQAQFIVATHSPFIVSAVEDSAVYALRYAGSVGKSGFPRRGPRKVRSLVLDQTKKAGNASEILREVLGVAVTMPDWATKRLETIVADFEGAAINAKTLKSLRARLSAAGFAEYYPEALAKVVGEK